MNDSLIMKISLLMAVLGTVALFFIVQVVEPCKISPDEITEALDGQYVKTSGVVSSFYENQGNLFFYLDGIKVVFFQVGNYSIKDGDHVSVTGKVSIYRDKLEIIADEMEKI